jgi:hypothetical protein
MGQVRCALTQWSACDRSLGAITSSVCIYVHLWFLIASHRYHTSRGRMDIRFAAIEPQMNTDPHG